MEETENLCDSITYVLETILPLSDIEVESVKKEPRHQVTLCGIEPTVFSEFFEQMPSSLQSHFELTIRSATEEELVLDLKVPKYAPQRKKRYIGTPDYEMQVDEFLRAIEDIELYGEHRGLKPNIKIKSHSRTKFSIQLPIENSISLELVGFPYYIKYCTQITRTTDGSLELIFESPYEDPEFKSVTEGFERSKIHSQLKEIPFYCPNCGDKSMILEDGTIMNPSSILHCINCYYTISTKERIFYALLIEGMPLSDIQVVGPTKIESDSHPTQTTEVETINTILNKNQHTNIFTERENKIYSLFYQDAYQQLHVHKGSIIITYMAGTWDQIDESEQTNSSQNSRKNPIKSYCKRCLVQQPRNNLITVSAVHTTDHLYARQDRREYPYIDHGEMVRIKICPSCYTELREIVRDIESKNTEQILANNV